MKRFQAKVLAPVAALILGTPAFAVDTAAQRVDINTATQEQLKTTLGVGDDDAQRIINARPYYKKEDLKAKKVISAEAFDKVQRLIDSVC